MSRRDFLEDFVDSSLWSTTPAKYLFKYKKDPNTGMKETHRLALTMGQGNRVWLTPLGTPFSSH